MNLLTIYLRRIFRQGRTAAKGRIEYESRNQKDAGHGKTGTVCGHHCGAVDDAAGLHPAGRCQGDLTSLIVNTLTPSLTSFTFSPFYSLGGVSGNGWSLVICFVPRILVGIIPYFVFRGLKKLIKSDTVPLAVCGFVGSMVNTLLVMNLIYVFFGDSWGSAKGVAGDLIYKAILAVIATNGIPEAIVAALITAAVGKVLLKLGAR